MGWQSLGSFPVKRQYIADLAGTHNQHHKAIDTQCYPATGGHAMFQCRKQMLVDWTIWQPLFLATHIIGLKTATLGRRIRQFPIAIGQFEAVDV